MKKLIPLLLLLFLFSLAEAQKGSTIRPFNFSKGYKSSWGPGYSFYVFNDRQGAIASFNYAPQVDLTNKHSDFSFSLNTQMSAGINTTAKRDSGLFLYAHIPLFLEMNLGHLASKDFYNENGYFIGAGYDVSIFRKKLQHGPAFTIGLRSWIFGKSLTLRYILSNPLSAGTLIHTVSLNLNVGNYLETVKANNKISNFGE